MPRGRPALAQCVARPPPSFLQTFSKPFQNIFQAIAEAALRDINSVGAKKLEKSDSDLTNRNREEAKDKDRSNHTDCLDKS
jgi:hypothetical protein